MTTTVAGAFAFRGAMADEDNTTRQASADGDSGVHHLRDIVVEEVSLVDRAANKRRFLVVKRSSEMADDGKSKDRGTSQEGRSGAAHREGGKKPKPKPDEGVDKARPRVMRAAAGDEEDEEETEKARRPRPSQDEDDDEVDAGKAAPGDEDEDEEDEDEAKASKTRSRAKGDVDGRYPPDRHHLAGMTRGMRQRPSDARRAT
jgi:hypothetical protein